MKYTVIVSSMDNKVLFVVNDIDNVKDANISARSLNKIFKTINGWHGCNAKVALSYNMTEILEDMSANIDEDKDNF